MTQHRDILVVGGGPVGSAFALAMAVSPLTITVLEARDQDADAENNRTLALSYGSKLLLEGLDAWRQDTLRATPITSVHVSERGRFGRTLLRAVDLDLPALGYTVKYGALAQALAQVTQERGISYRYGALVQKIATTGSYATLEIARGDSTEMLTAGVAVIADGGSSNVDVAGSETTVKEYDQVAVVGTLKTNVLHGNIAYERFTPSGPVALLPDGDGFAFVWTVTGAQREETLALNDAEFLTRFQAQLGDRAGQFHSVSKRTAFPLKLRRTLPVVSKRVVRIGNAAQTLHPVAAQGFNLGLRDACVLAQNLSEAGAADRFDAALRSYERARSPDAGLAIRLTDLLVRGFSDRNPIVSAGRAVALQALDILPPARRLFARKMIFGA